MKICSFILFTILLSCTSNAGEQDRGIALDIPLNLDNREIGLSEIADSLDYIFLETNDASVIGAVDKLIVTDNNVILVDKDKTRSVFIFDKQGKFIAKINRVGRGPSEYISISDVAVDESNNKIFLSDNKSGNLLMYSFDGEFISKMPFRYIVRSIEYVGDGIIAAYSGFSTNKNLLKDGEYPNLFLFDTNSGNVIDKYFYFDKKLVRSNIVDLVSNFSRCNGKTIFFMPLRDTLYSVTKDGVNAEVYLNFSADQQTKVSDFIDHATSDRLTAEKASLEFINSDFAYIMNCIRTDSLLYLFYKVKERYYYGFNFINSGRFEEAVIKYNGSGSMIPVKNDIDNTIRFMPLTADSDNNFYYILEPYVFDYLDDSKIVKFLKSRVGVSDNPVVASVKMKSS